MQFNTDRSHEKTGFQTPMYHPTIDLRTDVVFVYGWNQSLPERVAQYRAQGYRVHFMAGVAWGHYFEYLDGDFDGRTHYDEAQVARNGERIDHGDRTKIFYFVPTPSYVNFLKTLAQRVIDAGVDAIHMEEPEFWSRGGYSEAFQRLWRDAYDTEWQPPHSTPEAWYDAARLKYRLYTDALEAIFQHAKTYAASQGREVRCYVDSHSLINYAQWGIVSPESNLAHLSVCDGYVCQVWTGTARTPNHYRGQRAERTLETAYLEYGQMAAMVLATGRKVWFLADPIEDDPRYDWDDYRQNYHATLVASLLHPDVDNFEVMPWPDRVFNRTYPRHLPAEQQSAISPAYARELLTIANALANMPGTADSVVMGTRGIGLAIADTLLFERGFEEPEQTVLRTPGDVSPPDQIYRLRPGANPELDAFFGLALPLLKQGIPLRIGHLEHVGLPGYLAELDVLVLSYDAMKPPSVETHQALAAWVREGGVLVYWGQPDPLPFDSVWAWWRQDGRSYAKPSDHILEILGGRPQPGRLQPVGSGSLLVIDQSAAEVALDGELADAYVRTVRQAYQASRQRAGEWREQSFLLAHRGPYIAAASLEGGQTRSSAQSLTGAYLDLFHGDLPVRSGIQFEPGDTYFLYDLAVVPGERCVLAATGRVESERWEANLACITVTCPQAVRGQLVIRLPGCPSLIRMRTPDGSAEQSNLEWSWEAAHNLARIWYDGSPAGVEITLDL
jgi:hypothetical protein